MNKKRLVQLGIVVGMLVIVGIGGIWAYKKGKIFSRADTLPSVLSLQAVLPSVADDMAQNHWARQYVDAVTKSIYGPAKNEPVIGPYVVNDQPYFMPDAPIENEHIAFYILRLKGIDVSGCSGSYYKDVNSTNLNVSWACPQVEMAARLGYFNGTAWAPVTPMGYFNPGSTFYVSTLKKILTNAGIGTTTPPGYTCGECTTSRAAAAAYMAYNTGLVTVASSSGDTCGDNCLVSQPAVAGVTSTGTDPYPSVYMQWNFPSDPNAGFDFGYEVWRLDPGATAYNLLYAQDPPEEGMEEGSDLGMFYDKSVAKGQKYTYQVLLMNRVGDYSGSAGSSAQLAQSDLIRRAHAAGTRPAEVSIQVP